jgi:hypothetical protein
MGFSKCGVTLGRKVDGSAGRNDGGLKSSDQKGGGATSCSSSDVSLIIGCATSSSGCASFTVPDDSLESFLWKGTSESEEEDIECEEIEERLDVSLLA